MGNLSEKDENHGGNVNRFAPIIIIIMEARHCCLDKCVWLTIKTKEKSKDRR